MTESLMDCAAVIEHLGITRQALYAGIRRGTYPAPVPGTRGAGKRSLWRREDLQSRVNARVDGAGLRAKCLSAGAGPLIEGCDAALLGHTVTESGPAPVYDRASVIELLKTAGLPDAKKWATEGAGAALGVVWVDRD